MNELGIFLSASRRLALPLRLRASVSASAKGMRAQLDRVGLVHTITVRSITFPI